MTDEARELAAEILVDRGPSTPVSRRQGVVDAVNTDGTVDVELAASGVVIPGVSYMAHYSPVAGDTVFVEFAGSDPVVVGRLADTRVGTPSAATVGTDETTTSTSYTDLATVGPSVTVATRTSALLILTVQLNNSGTGVSFVGCAVSGATTVAAIDADALFTSDAAGGSVDHRMSAARLVTGLTPGSNTFTAKYRVSGGTGTFQRRDIIVLPLPE